MMNHTSNNKLNRYLHFCTCKFCSFYLYIMLFTHRFISTKLCVCLQNGLHSRHYSPPPTQNLYSLEWAYKLGGQLNVLKVPRFTCCYYYHVSFSYLLCVNKLSLRKMQSMPVLLTDTQVQQIQQMGGLMYQPHHGIIFISDRNTSRIRRTTIPSTICPSGNIQS